MRFRSPRKSAFQIARHEKMLVMQSGIYYNDALIDIDAGYAGKLALGP